MDNYQNKKRHLKLYSGFIDQKSIEYKNLPKISKDIILYSRGRYPYFHEKSIEGDQAQVNSRNLWFQFVNFHYKISDNIASILSWYFILNQEIKRSGLIEPNTIYKGYVKQLKTQNQIDSFFELSEKLNSCIIKILTVKDKIIRIIIHSLPNVFERYNKTVFVGNKEKNLLLI